MTVDLQEPRGVFVYRMLQIPRRRFTNRSLSCALGLVDHRDLLAPGTQVVRGRWADVDTGDEARPNYQSRQVATKTGVKGSLVAEFFPAMPPLSCSKIPLILAACDRIPDCDGVRHAPATPLCVSLIDAKGAR